MKPQHHLRATTAATLAAFAAGALLSACGSGNPSGAEVTVTVTPTVTVKPGGPTSAAPKVPRSDVKGRAYDFGLVTKVGTLGGITFIELDRLTWQKLDDAKLARDGVPTGPFKGPVPYTNQNAKLTYTIPVADGARILYSHCIAADQPLQTKSVPATGLKGLADRENTVLVQIDANGNATAIQNIPGCPG
jgi:hypothetical protein